MRALRQIPNQPQTRTLIKALIDADILRYEIGFAAETGWRHISNDDGSLPRFEYVAQLLEQRLQHILTATDANDYQLYLTEGPNFRDELAVTKPYKGTRPDQKPWHFANLTAWMRSVLPTVVVTGVEADDMLAIDHTRGEGQTILCSRDKDLRQVPGWFYSWELGHQPSFGPYKVEAPGHLTLGNSKTPKVTGSGYAFFCAQLLMGDPVDNVPGLPKVGPKGAWDLLSPVLERPDTSCDALYQAVLEAYEEKLGDEAEEYLLEQGRLLWMTRNLHQDGSPVLWELGMTE